MTKEKFGGAFEMKNYVIGFITGVAITTISAIFDINSLR